MKRDEPCDERGRCEGQRVVKKTDGNFWRQRQRTVLYSNFQGGQYKTETVPLSYAMEDYQAEKLKGKPKALATSGRNGIVVEVGSKDQSERVRDVQDILSKDCTVKDHEFFNVTKGIIYIYDSNISDLQAFEKGLQQRYTVVEVSLATFIKPRIRMPRHYRLNSELTHVRNISK